MKTTKYLLSMMLGLAMIGCSDELDEGPSGQVEVGGETGYAKISINLPTAPVSRAANDQFDDGRKEEYLVKKSMLLYFVGNKGGAEEDATFAGAYNLPLSAWRDNPNEPITTSADAVVQAPLYKDKQLYVLAILNYPTDSSNPVISFNSTSHSFKIKDTEYLATGSSLNLAELRKKLADQTLTDYTGASNDAFTMLNAPLSTIPSAPTVTGMGVQTLVPVTVYKSEKEANNPSTPASDIYVERVVAKVTLSGFTTGPEINGHSNYHAVEGLDNHLVVLEGWDLDITNKSTKLLHDVIGTGETPNRNGYDLWKTLANPLSVSQSNNRFVGTAFPYRFYWAVDGNYSGGYTFADITNKCEDEFSYLADVPNNSAEYGVGHPKYCFENTFDLANMNKNQTTRILLKTKYYVDKTKGEAETFFTSDRYDSKSGKVIMYTVDQMVQEIVTIQGLQTLDNKILTNDLKALEAGSYTTTGQLTASLSVLTNDSKKAEAILNYFGQLKCFKNGTSYYTVTNIQHFGDTYTVAPTGNSYGINTDETANGNYLGRYGVVRNNWYNLNINKISGPGEPNIPPIIPDIDDKEDGYIKASINVLSWAKRDQNVDL